MSHEVGMKDAVARGNREDALNIESAVRERYARAAAQREPALCCPDRSYDERLLSKLPREIVEKDYGCGDSTAHVHDGDVVIDLGSGSGKTCYLLAQKVGRSGSVIGVDVNDAMLALARRYQEEIAGTWGHGNVRFVKARIQDMALDLERAEDWLREHPVITLEGRDAFEAECARQRREEPAVADESVDVVVSNCVLNLVQPADKPRLFREMYRVLRRGGRAVISDIVCDEDPTPAIMNDPVLWSGCIAGAFREDAFLEHFERSGFYGIEVLSRQAEPWQIIDGIEFRSITVRAYKGKEGPCLERNQAVIYKGPWRRVSDDDGHTLIRGQRMAVCDKTFQLMTDASGPYAGQIVPVPPRLGVPLEQATVFDCKRSGQRHPRETKGLEFRDTLTSDDGPCAGAECC
jgi:SAM-dependent methyltransferase